MRVDFSQLGDVDVALRIGRVQLQGGRYGALPFPEAPQHRTLVLQAPGLGLFQA